MDIATIATAIISFLIIEKFKKIISATLKYATLHQIHKQGIATTDVPTDIPAIMSEISLSLSICKQPTLLTGLDLL